MLKKIVKFTLLGFAVLVVAGGATLAFLLRKPAPEDVCTNLFDLTQTELERTLAKGFEASVGEFDGKLTREDAAEALGMTFDQCVSKRKAHYENAEFGLLPMARQARCEAVAETVEEFQNC